MVIPAKFKHSTGQLAVSGQSFSPSFTPSSPSYWEYGAQATLSTLNDALSFVLFWKVCGDLALPFFSCLILVLHKIIKC